MSVDLPGRPKGFRLSPMAAGVGVLVLLAQLLAPLPAAVGLPAQLTSPGRVFLGPDGQPLPFRSDEEILRFLQEAEVVSLKRIPVGITRPQEALLEKDGVRARAAYRDFDETYERVRLSDGDFFMNLRDSYLHEAAAYQMARLLGLDSVPPAVARRHSGKMVTLQLWIENALVESERRAEGLQPEGAREFRLQVQTMYLFDELIANVDRNEGNLLFDRDTWKLWMIDHTRGFQRTRDLRGVDKITWCRADLWERLRALQRAEVDRALARLVGRYEIDALFERRDKLVAHIQGLIDKYGESAVLFDPAR
jgi:hypothetical protein